MSDPVSRQPSSTEAARNDTPSAEFPAHDPRSPHWPIEREIERSERASAALAATRALARAAFTDSQLAAEDAADHDDAVDSGWVRTEYVAFEHSMPPDDEVAPDRPQRILAGGSFDPGIASQEGRAFPGASMADASLKTRTGAQARFLQESRHASRGERSGQAERRARPRDATRRDERAAPPARTPASSARAAAPPRAPAPAREGLKFLLAAALGGVVVLAGGSVAWKTGLLSRRDAPPATAAVSPAPATAAQAEAARVLSPAQQEIPITPAAGPTPPRSQAETDAALAADARAAALPAEAVRPVEPAAQAQPTAKVAPATVPAHAVHGKADVAAAIANAQAKAERFLSSGGGGASAPAATEGRQAP